MCIELAFRESNLAGVDASHVERIARESNTSRLGALHEVGVLVSCNAKISVNDRNLFPHACVSPLPDTADQPDIDVRAISQIKSADTWLEWCAIFAVLMLTILRRQIQQARSRQYSKVLCGRRPANQKSFRFSKISSRQTHFSPR